MTSRYLHMMFLLFTLWTNYAMAQSLAPNAGDSPLARKIPALPAAPQTGMLVQPTIAIQALILQIDEANNGSMKDEIRRRFASMDGAHVNERQLIEQLQEISVLTILSRPQIALVENTPGQVTIGEEREIQYMVPTDKNLFRLTTTKPVRLGMDFGVTARVNQETNRFSLDPVELTLYAIEGREQAIGTDLPVGKPRIARRSVSTSLELVSGQFGLVELQVSDTRQVWVGLSARILTDKEDAKSPPTSPHP